MSLRVPIPAFHPYAQRAREGSYLLPLIGPYARDFWTRVDLHRQWAHVEVNFDRERWGRELKTFELLEVQWLEKEKAQRVHELGQIVPRDDASRTLCSVRQNEIDACQARIQTKQSELDKYRQSFVEMCELQERVLCDKKELQFITSLVPLPYYVFALVSSVVGLYFLFRQPVRQRVLEVREDVRAVTEELKSLRVLVEKLPAAVAALSPPPPTSMIVAPPLSYLNSNLFPWIAARTVRSELAYLVGFLMGFIAHIVMRFIVR